MRIGGRRISKKLLFIVLPLALVIMGFGSAVAVGAVQFSDIAGNTHEASILKEAARGITTGFPDGTFRPDQPVTRGQMMTFLDRFNSGITCTECHDARGELVSKKDAWATSLHGNLEENVFLTEGVEAGCTGCHSGIGFSDMIAAGKSPNQMTEEEVDPNPTPQDCRACHEIHTTFTHADYTLRTTAPVALYATPGQTYDGSASNLCANCHQDRRQIPAPDADGNVATNSRFGPHHGPQASMLLGVAGAGPTASTKSVHYLVVPDACVTCHMGPITDVHPGEGEEEETEADERPEAGHTFVPSVQNCVSCHPDAEDFDIGGTQTEVKAKLETLKAALQAKGLLNANGGPVTGKFPKVQAEALWNYQTIAVEDRSFGVHNPTYIKALLDDSIAALQ